MFNSVKANKDYSVKILTDSTSKSVGRSVKRHRASISLKALAAGLLAFAFVGGGVASAASASTVTAQQARADIVADLLCVNAENGDKVGSWDDGKSRFASLGGQTESMSEVRFNMLPSTFLAPSTGRVEGAVNHKLTAFEKYGSAYPRFESWTPAWTDDTFLFQGIGPTAGLGSGGQLPSGSTDGSEPLPVGSTRLLTNNSLSCVGLQGNIESGVANIMLALPRFILMLSTQAYDSAIDASLTNPASPLHGFGEVVDDIITRDGGLRDSLFIPFLIPLILVGAAYVGYIGIVKRAAMKAVQSTVWMVAAIAAGTVFMAQPTLIAGVADDLVTKVQNIINDSIPLTMDDDSGMCEATGDSVAKREAACLLWKNSVYEPWAAGQFGNPSHPDADPRNILNNPNYSIQYGSESVEAASWPQFMVDRQATGLALQNSEVAYAQLSGGENGVGGVGGNQVWAGGTWSQINAAMMIGFAVPIHGLVPLVLALTQLFFQLLMLALVFFSPVFFLLGVIPNWGRRVLMRFAELLVVLTIKRILTMVLLAFYFVAYSIVTSTNMPIFLETAMVAVLAIVILFGRSSFTNLFIGHINFGGNKAVGIPGGKAAAVGAALAGAGLGAALAGPIGALVGGLGTKKAADSASEGTTAKPESENRPAGERPKQQAQQAVKAGQQINKTLNAGPTPSAPASTPASGAVTQAAAVAAPAVVAAVAPPAAPVAAAATQQVAGKAAASAAVKATETVIDTRVAPKPQQQVTPPVTQPAPVQAAPQAPAVQAAAPVAKAAPIAPAPSARATASAPKAAQVQAQPFPQSIPASNGSGLQGASLPQQPTGTAAPTGSPAVAAPRPPAKKS